VKAIQIDAILAGVIDPTTGLPASGGLVEFFEAGTTTPKSVWTEQSKSNAYQSYTLDAAGSAALFGDGLYDIVITNSLSVEIYSWSNVSLRYPDYTTETVSVSYAQTAEDDYIIVDGSTDAITITLLSPDEWSSNRPLTIINNSDYAVTLDSDGVNINGVDTLDIASGSGPVVVYNHTDTFFMAGAEHETITDTSSGRQAEATADGLADNSDDHGTSFYLLGHSTYSCRLISAVIDVTYSSASHVNIAITSNTYFGFAAPALVSSGALAAGESGSGISLGASGATITFTAAALCPTADASIFMGAFPAQLCGYVIDTSGVPSCFAYAATGGATLVLTYYEDGAAANLVSAVASSGRSVRMHIAYAMRPTA
jgi:hypothetical protein